MRVSLAPIPYFWDQETVRRFYKDIVNLPVDIVYLGETVCAKRRSLRLEDWLEIAQDLTVAGMEVVLSTLTLMEAESELAALKKITTNGKFIVEANDMAAVQMLAGNSPFVIGTHINIYNDKSLALLHGLGARRWVIPAELRQETITRVLAHRPPGLETEVIGYGRLPLAHSARCFSARARNRAKDDCGFACGEDPDGTLLATQDMDALLIINGVQIQSARVQNLIGHGAELVRTGIDIFRVVPHLQDMQETLNLIREALTGTVDPESAAGRLSRQQPYGCSDGYYHGRDGMGWYA